MRILNVTGWLLLGAALAAQTGKEPMAEISNGQIQARLYLPHAETGYYRATRFDWSGVVSSLEYRGHNYFGVWFARYDPKGHDSITGPVEEYRTGESALGYDEAKVGGSFIRIGVGVLRKPEEPRFQQFKTYDIVDPGQWTVRPSADAVEFTHVVSDTASGYGYRLRKIVKLMPGAPRMVIEHVLTNTGKKRIDTNVYNHNFFVLDGQTPGPDVTLKFPFDLVGKGDLRGLAEIRGKELAYLQEMPVRGSIITELTGFGTAASDFDIRVENRKSGAGVRVTADRPLSRLVFWSQRPVLSPEPYIEMSIEPGRESSWRLTYDFYTVPPSAAR